MEVLVLSRLRLVRSLFTQSRRLASLAAGGTAAGARFARVLAGHQPRDTTGLKL
jgi:hypothetical protein